MKKDKEEVKTLPPVNRIYQAHCLEFLKKLPDECIDTIVTSPPYWGLRDYGQSTYTIWDRNGIPCQHEWNIHDSKMPGGFCRHCCAWYGQLGLEPTIDLYIKHLCDIFDEVKRVLKRQGSCWVNLGDTYYTRSGSSFENDNLVRKNGKEVQKTTGINTANQIRGRGLLPTKCLTQIPSRFALEMCNRGWILRNEIIWHKPNVMPSSVKDRFTVDFEKIFFFVKSKKYWFETQYEEYAPNSDVRYRQALRANRSYTVKEPYKQNTPYGKNYKREQGSVRSRGNDADGLVVGGFNPNGRNKRCVWRIATKPFPEAHFATFPEALIDAPITCGCPEYICKACKRPRNKIYEFWYEPQAGKGYRTETPKVKGRKSGYDVGNVSPQEMKYGTAYKRASFRGYTDCGCRAGFEPGVVLDPFMGSGTVAVVAGRLGRNFIGVELNPDYITIAQKRLQAMEKR